MGLAAAGDMGTNSGACTLNLKGVAGALALALAAGPGGATAAATAAPSSSLVAALLVAHLTTTSLLSCAMAVRTLVVVG